jgi:hypothetical protein
MDCVICHLCGELVDRGCTRLGCPEIRLNHNSTILRDIAKADGPHPPDMVNHPPHYTSHPSGVECITITEHMTFNIGNAIKYLWRNGLKDAKVHNLEDLKKAHWYIEREIERLSK